MRDIVAFDLATHTGERVRGHMRALPAIALASSLDSTLSLHTLSLHSLYTLSVYTLSLHSLSDLLGLMLQSSLIT